MLQECVLGPGMGPAGCQDRGLWGQPCPSAMPGHVCAMGPGGGSGFFPPAFLFPLLYVTAQIFGLSQLQGGGAGSAAQRTWGPSLHPLGAAGHRESRQGIGDAEIAHAYCTGGHWPELAWELSAEVVGTTSLPPQGLPGLDPPRQGPAVVGSRIQAGQRLLWGISASFPIDFFPSQTTLHPSCLPLLGPAPGRALGSQGHPIHSVVWHWP